MFGAQRTEQSDRDRTAYMHIQPCLDCLRFGHPLRWPLLLLLPNLSALSIDDLWRPIGRTCLLACRLVAFIAFHLIFSAHFLTGRPIGHAVLGLHCQERLTLHTELSISSSQSASVIWPERASHLSRLLHRVSSITSTPFLYYRKQYCTPFGYMQHSPSLATESIFP